MIHETMRMADHKQTVGQQDLVRHDLVKKDLVKQEHQESDPLDKANCDLADGLLTRAIKDARQSQDRTLQQEALAWLWVCCPDVADDLRLPALKPSEIQPDVMEYLQRYSALSFS